MGNTSRIIKLLQHAVLLCLPSLMISPVLADETEIFYQNEGSKVNANVLFLLDASGSMKAELSDSGGRSRMQVMKDTFREVMDSAPSNINLGLLHYANARFIPSYQWDSVKGVTFPVSPINADASTVIAASASSDNLPDPVAGLPVRAFLADIVDSWQPAGYTPIVDALFEASRYFRGESVLWGKHSPAYGWAAHPSSYTGALTCASPRQEECSLDWGECNATVDSSTCTTRQYSDCCNWQTDASGNQFCENNDFSCGVGVQFCQHTVCDAYSGEPVYKSPIEYSCQANYLVLMSDGKPEYPYWDGVTVDGTGHYPESVNPDFVHDPNTIPNLLPEITGLNFPTTIPAMIGGGCVDAPQGYNSGKCGPELTQFMKNNDQSSTIAGDQFIDTFTVAFGMGDEPTGTAYLAQLATAENGAYTANNPQELAAALQGILGDVQKNSFSFSSPSFAVDENSMLSHGSNIYLPVFDASNTPLWSGNLRKFGIDANGNIVGAGGTPVVNEDGTFKETAQDLWSSAAHGADVTVGGAANKLPNPASRKLVTDAGSKNLVDIKPESSVITSTLLATSTYRTKYNLLDRVNTGSGSSGSDGISCYGYYYDCAGVKRTVIGSVSSGQGCVNVKEVTTCPTNPPTAEQRATLINFMRGYKDGVAGTGAQARQHMGDMLNSKTAVLDYGNGVTRVIAATNEGFLHSIDANTGIEQWAFMPESLLKHTDMFLRNEDRNTHVYGLDGPLAIWRVDHNKNGIIETTRTHDYTGDGKLDADDEDSIRMFFGMRRGGRMYYGLDLTAVDNPKVLWKISPESGSGAVSTGFSQLGETWSKPTLSKLRVGAGVTGNSTLSVLKHVLVFGGGYDPRKDVEDVAVRQPDQWGHDVFMVDAKTGELVWSLKSGYHYDMGTKTAISGASSLTHSVASDIRILDMDGNGALDRLYFGDTGGNLWRVDMDVDVADGGETYYDYGKAKLTKLASLGGGSTTVDHRKFFYEPDTAMRMQGGKPILTIAIGSGYRTHPLNTTAAEDRFYVLMDENVYTRPAASTATLTDDNFKDAKTIESSKSILDYPDMKGWYYDFAHHGEKVLAPVLTVLDKVVFTTFAQADQAGNPSVVEACKPAVNTSRAYVLDLLKGRAVIDLSRPKDEVADDFVVAGVNELLDAPQLVFGKPTATDPEGDCQLGNCQQDVMVRIGKLELPLLDMGNTLNSGTASYSEMIDVTRLLPRLYWLDNDVTGNVGQ